MYEPNSHTVLENVWFTTSKYLLIVNDFFSRQFIYLLTYFGILFAF